MAGTELLGNLLRDGEEVPVASVSEAGDYIKNQPGHLVQGACSNPEDSLSGIMGVGSSFVVP